MASSRRFGQAAFKRQTGGIGFPETTAQFTVPMISGNLNPQKEWDDLPRAGNTMAKLGRFPTKAHGGGTISMLAHPEALGLLIAQAMGTEVFTANTTVTSFGPPIVTGVSAGTGLHVFTMSEIYPEPLTVWTSIGAIPTQGQVWRFDDCFIKRLKISGQSGNNCIVEVEFISWSYAPLAAMPALASAVALVRPIGVSEDADPRFKFIGSNVKLDPNSFPATVAQTNAESADFEVDRNPEIKYGPSLTPTVIAPDRMVNFSTNMTYDSTQSNWDYLLTAYTGSPAGTGPDQGTPQGAIDVTYGRHPGTPTGQRLNISSNGNNWEYTAERPDAEATPGIMEVAVNGILVSPTAFGGVGTSETIVTLTNNYNFSYV